MFLEFGLTKKAVGVFAVTLLALTGVVGVSQDAKAALPGYCTPGEITLPVEGVKVVIETQEQLMHFSLSQDLYRSSSIILRADLDVSLCNWLPVGTENHPFVGVFDGGGHAISFISDNYDDVKPGFFGVLVGAVVLDLRLSGKVLNDDVSSTGGLAGRAVETTIANTSFEGSVLVTGEGARFIGGLVGYADNSTITNSRASGPIEGSVWVGGLVGGAGFGFLAISNSKFSGDVLSRGEAGNANKAGGIIGECGDGSCKLFRVSTTGSVVSLNADPAKNFGSRTGGLAGDLSESSSITESFSASNITGHKVAGGLVGYLRGTIERSFSLGNLKILTVPDKRGESGGIVGESSGGSKVYEAYSAGSVSVLYDAGERIGTFIGRADSGTQISNSVSRSDAGHSMTTVRVIGFGSPNTSTLESRNTMDMQDQATFEALGWDFSENIVWEMSSPSDPTFKGFPVLKWQNLGTTQNVTAGGGSAPQATISSSGTNLNVNLNKSRVLRLSGSNLNLVREARVGGKKATINFARSNSGTLVISKLPLLPSGKYTLTLLTSTGLVAGEVEVVKKAKIRKLRAVEASGNLKKQIRDVLQKTNRTYALAGTLRCWGVTTSSSTRELNLARQRAEAACEYAKSLKPELEVVALSRTGNGKPARNQVVKIRYIK